MAFSDIDGRLATANAWLESSQYEKMNFVYHLGRGGYRAFSDALDRFIEVHGRRPVTYNVWADLWVGGYAVSAVSVVDQKSGVFRLVIVLHEGLTENTIDLCLDDGTVVDYSALRERINGFTSELYPEAQEQIFMGVKSFYAAMLEENYGAQTLLDDQCEGISEELKEFQSVTAENVHGELYSDVEYNSSTLSARHVQDILKYSKHYSRLPPTGLRLRVAELDSGEDEGSSWVLKCVGYRWKLELAVGRLEIRSFGVVSDESAYAEVYEFVLTHMFRAAPAEVRVALAEERASFVKRFISGLKQESLNV